MTSSAFRTSAYPSSLTPPGPGTYRFPMPPLLPHYPTHPGLSPHHSLFASTSKHPHELALAAAFNGLGQSHLDNSRLQSLSAYAPHSQSSHLSSSSASSLSSEPRQSSLSRLKNGSSLVGSPVTANGGNPSVTSPASDCNSKNSGKHNGHHHSSSNHHHREHNGSNSQSNQNHIKKPLNAFMLYMKEMRTQVVQEYTLKESAAINQILGKKVRK